MLDPGLHVSGERTVPRRGGIYAARQLGVNAVRSNQTTPTRNTRAGYIPPLQLPKLRHCHICSFPNKTERACPFRLVDTELHVSDERTVPRRGGIKARRETQPFLSEPEPPNRLAKAGEALPLTNRSRQMVHSHRRGRCLLPCSFPPSPSPLQAAHLPAVCQGRRSSIEGDNR